MPGLQMLDGKHIDPLILHELQQPSTLQPEMLPPGDASPPTPRREVLMPGVP